MQMKCILKYNRYNLHTNNPVVKKVIPHPKHRAEGSADMQWQGINGETHPRVL